jgi:hypothetical protein
MLVTTALFVYQSDDDDNRFICFTASASFLPPTSRPHSSSSTRPSTLNGGDNRSFSTNKQTHNIAVTTASLSTNKQINHMAVTTASISTNTQTHNNAETTATLNTSREHGGDNRFPEHGGDNRFNNNTVSFLIRSHIGSSFFLNLEAFPTASLAHCDTMPTKWYYISGCPFEGSAARREQPM